MLTDIPVFAKSCKPLQQNQENRITLKDFIPFTNGRTVHSFSTRMRWESCASWACAPAPWPTVPRH